MRLGQASLSRNAAFSIAGYVLSAATAFFLAPFIIRSLGDSRYGTWILIAEIGGYYGILEIGVRSAVSYFVATKQARGEGTQIAGFISAAFWSLTALGLVVLLAGSLVAYLLPRILQLEAVSPAETRLAMLVLTALVAVHLPFDIFAAAVNGCRRIDLIQGTDILVRLLTAAGIVLVLRSGGGLVEMALLQLAGKVLTWFAMVGFARELLPQLRIAPRLVSREILRLLYGFGSRTFAINLSQLVIGRAGLLVIASLLTVSLNTFYAIGKVLVDYASQLILSLGWSFTMHFADIHGRGAHEELERVYFRGLRFAAVITFSMSAFLLLFGEPFVRLWVGPTYVEGPWTRRSDVVLFILVAGSLPRWLHVMSWQLLQGTGKIETLTRLAVLEAGTNLVLTLLLVRHFGLAGVALGTMMPAIVVHGLILPSHVVSALGISRRRFLREGFARAALVGLTAAIAGVVLRATVGTQSWHSLIAAVGGAASATFLAIPFVGVTAAERKEIWRRLLAMLSLPPFGTDRLEP